MAAAVIGALGLALLAGAGTAARKAGPVTLTVGFGQDVDTFLPADGRARHRLRGLEHPVRHADRQGGGRLPQHPRARVVVEELQPRQDVDVHAATEPQVVGRTAAHVGRRRLHDQPRAAARRGSTTPRRSRTSRRRRRTRARSSSARRCPIPSCRRWTSTSSRSTSTTRSRRRT